MFSANDAGFAYALVSRREELGGLCREMNRALGGRGGGKGGFCQGSVSARRDKIVDFFGDYYKTGLN